MNQRDIKPCLRVTHGCFTHQKRKQRQLSYRQEVASAGELSWRLETSFEGRQSMLNICQQIEFRNRLLIIAIFSLSSHTLSLSHSLNGPTRQLNNHAVVLASKPAECFQCSWQHADTGSTMAADKSAKFNCCISPVCMC